MGIRQEGSRIIVDQSIEGSVFPTSERELPFPILVSSKHGAISIEGSLYGRSLELRGDVQVRGPVVSRGDTRLDPLDKKIKLLSGLTVNGTVNVVAAPQENRSGSHSIRGARIVIKGDIACNQNVSLKDTVVFGSISAVNCSLEDSVVLGTCIATESLRVSSSTIGGYAGREITFEGRCLLLNAIGESYLRPLFLPRELPAGGIEPLDLRFYPITRAIGGLRNDEELARKSTSNYSMLYPVADWVKVSAASNPALDEQDGEVVEKWVLSIGGRISDLSAVESSISAMTNLLKCGFEFEHYHPDQRSRHIGDVSHALNEDEKWLLREVCVL